MLFLEYALESPCKFNAALQSSLPMLPSLKTEVKCMLRISFGRFIKAAEDNISKVKLDDAEVQLPDSQLGMVIRPEHTCQKKAMILTLT